MAMNEHVRIEKMRLMEKSEHMRLAMELVSDNVSMNDCA